MVNYNWTRQPKHNNVFGDCRDGLLLVFTIAMYGTGRWGQVAADVETR